MDSLSVALLVTLFMLSGSGLTTATLLTMLFTGFVELTHITLFVLGVLLTYFMYGFTGMLVVMFSTFAMITAGAMYWFEVSLNDANQKMKELVANQDNADNTNESKELTQMEKKMKELNEYKTKGLQTFYEKTGLNDEKITEFKTYYKTASERFEQLLTMLYNYVVQFKDATENVAGLREIYRVYYYVVNVKKGIESARALHKLSRNMQMPVPASTNASSNTSSNDAQPSADPFATLAGGMGGLGSGMDFGNLADMNRQMEQQLANMTPVQRKQMEDMTKQMFGNMNIGDMMDMFGGLQGMSGNNVPRKRK